MPQVCPSTSYLTRIALLEWQCDCNQACETKFLVQVHAHLHTYAAYLRACKSTRVCHRSSELNTIVAHSQYTLERNTYRP